MWRANIYLWLPRFRLGGRMDILRRVLSNIRYPEGDVADLLERYALISLAYQLVFLEDGGLFPVQLAYFYIPSVVWDTYALSIPIQQWIKGGMKKEWSDILSRFTSETTSPTGPSVIFLFLVLAGIAAACHLIITIPVLLPYIIVFGHSLRWKKHNRMNAIRLPGSEWDINPQLPDPLLHRAIHFVSSEEKEFFSRIM